MNKFNHNFTLYDKAPYSRFFASNNNIARIDFVSESCIRVAHYKAEEELLPTFSVCPDNSLLLNGRNRLSLDGFGLCEPLINEGDGEESYLLSCGVNIKLDLHNFNLSYYIEDKLLFADRKPLAYNLEGEFGKNSFHYITREKDEKIYGLGDKGGDLNKSGRAFRIECSDAMGYDAKESDPLYKHLPFYICENSVGTYGIFYDTTDTSYADFGKEINNYYPTYKHFRTEDNALVYYVFFGSKLSVLQQFCSLCGKQPLPPRWSFDYCGSTMAYTDAPDSENQLDGFLNKLKDLGLSCGGFYLSSGYTSIGKLRCVFHWNKDKFLSPEGFIEKFRKEGITVIPNIKPAFLQSHPLYAEIAEKGYFIKNSDGTPFITEFWDGLGSYLDFTNPLAFMFWEEKVKDTLLDYGITATWNDNNEFDIKDEDAVASGFGNGEVKASRIRPALTYLMVLSSYMAQMKKDCHKRPFLSTRSGNIAVRRLAQTWSGDNRSEFKDLRYCHNIGLTMSLSGFFFYGHDLGGFDGDMPSRELLLRWLQHGVFEPRFTIHSWNKDGSATMPWSYEDIIPSVRKILAQRKRLIPYIYSCAYSATEKEIPLNAPAFLYYDDEKLKQENDTMMLGKDILVAFIFDEGKTETEVYLPKKDSWYLGDKLYKGGQKIKVNIPAEDEMPYFVKAGSIIPQNEAPYCFGSGDDINFTVYPVKDGEFKSEFFTDDGTSFAYRKNNCVRLEFTVTCEKDKVSVNYINNGNMNFDVQLKLCDGDSRELQVIKQML